MILELTQNEAAHAEYALRRAYENRLRPLAREVRDDGPSRAAVESVLNAEAGVINKLASARMRHEF